jgi:formylglycine-generating enzyme required for sulfatase activity
MIVIPSGSFKMVDLSGDGSKSEKPVGWVRLNYSFAVGKYEVTLGEYKPLMGWANLDWKYNRKPMEMVSWRNEKEFVKELSSKSGK